MGDRTKGLQILARSAAATVLVAGLGGCGVRSDLDIVNRTGRSVLAVTVSDEAGTSWELGDLRKGERINFDGRLAGEGGPLLSWSFNGRRYAEPGCYYSASWPSTPAQGEVRIEGERLSFRCT